MTLLTPWVALAAALVVLPLLILLYVLKLRRTTLRVPSTMLWRSSFEDLEANVPFRRLRFSALLLLQLAILLALLLAAAEPQSAGEPAAASRAILLIDQSASMSARDGAGGGTRLDQAKRAAIAIIDTLGQRGAPDSAMVIAFAASARVIIGFESHRPSLREAITSIQPTDEPGQLDAALRLAGAFAVRTETNAEAPPEVLLISDGGVAPPAGGSFDLSAGTFRFVRAGPSPDEPADNLGVVSFSARRDDEDLARVDLFVRLMSTLEKRQSVVLRFMRDDEIVGLREVEVPPGTSDGPGVVSITESVEAPRGGVLSVRHNFVDMLETDNTAAMVLDPPAQPRLVILHAEGGRADPFLIDLLEAVGAQSVSTMPLADDSVADLGAIAADVLIFDRVSGHRLPARPSVSIGGVPAGIEIIDSARPGGQRILSWERRQPLMRYVDLDDLVFADFGGFDLPPGARALASGADGPVVASLRSRGAAHVMIGFELQRSNWPLQTSCLIFLRNALDVLTQAESRRSGRIVSPGAMLTVRATPGSREVTARGVEVVRAPVRDGSASIGPLRQVGLWRVEGAAGTDQLAVSLLSDVETDLRTRGEISVNAQARAADAVQQVAQREYWPWLAMVSVALLLAEWSWYLWRARRRGRISVWQ